MKSILLIVVAVVLAAFSGCDRKTNFRLAAADSLMEVRPDSALEILDSVDSKSLSGENRAYYALLLTKAQYKNYITITSDSLINIALDYYDSGDRHIEALIYKGAALQDMGLTTEAIDCYKKAESLIPEDNYELLGYVNMRLGSLYSDVYIGNNEHIDKYKKALYYYNCSGNLKYQQVCASVIGALFRATNIDSAYVYLNKALKLSLRLNDKERVCYNTSLLARAYYIDSLYAKSKDVAVDIINNFGDYITDDAIFYDAAAAYAALGMTDSARFYLPKDDYSALSVQEKVERMVVLTKILYAEHRYKEAFDLNDQCTKLSDSITNNKEKIGFLS